VLLLSVSLLVFFLYRELTLLILQRKGSKRSLRIVTKMPVRSKIDGEVDVEVSYFQLDDILAKKKTILNSMCETLKKRGFICIKTKPTFLDASEKLRQVAMEYLSQDLTIKLNNMDPDKNNIGYVHIPGTREYIKLRPNDPEQLWPSSPEFRSAFQNFFNLYSQLAFTVFDILSHYADPTEPSKKQLIVESDYKAIEEFLPTKSSVSMIKYFTLQQPKEVCEEHTDTGILTFITRTHRPSLEIWDASINKYIRIEELVELGDIIAFTGEKVPLFSQAVSWRGTPHRVRMPAGPERMSIAFLLDVAK